MNVRVDRHDELQTELVDYLQIALPGGHHRIHQGGFARFGAGDQIGVGRRYRLEELTEDGGGTDHDRAPSFSASATTAGSSVARPASRPRLSAAFRETPRLSVASSELITTPLSVHPKWTQNPTSARLSSSLAPAQGTPLGRPA